MSQMVHVVSILDVPSLLGSVSFQSKAVKGAQNSLFLFCNIHDVDGVPSFEVSNM